MKFETAVKKSEFKAPFHSGSKIEKVNALEGLYRYDTNSYNRIYVTVQIETHPQFWFRGWSKFPIAVQ